ncbi:TolC family protein [Thalassotalea sediminis]|uniref:TolC family protein n=1 Tax=Thalassotalea sediminis TaxID=1759089 RepID=UPI00257477CE|nr:TolC family protein [Thalassotalea sediminis]
MIKVNYHQQIYLIFIYIVLLMFVPATHAKEELTLSDAIKIAQENDPWLHGSHLKQSALLNKSIAAGSLPNLKLTLAVMNLPTDSWHINQEGMTQLKMGVSQMLPRGDTLEIKQSQLAISASKQPLLRADRKAQLKREVTATWLDAYLAQQTILLIEENQALFEQMLAVAEARYSSGAAKTRQHDVINAQLELVQLTERLLQEEQKLDVARANLNEWLQGYDKQSISLSRIKRDKTSGYRVSSQLPSITLAHGITLKKGGKNTEKIAKLLLNHPKLQVFDVTLKVASKSIELAKQQYKPQWGLNASYGYRGDMPSGQRRADLFSVGVTVDLPIFTENKQDKEVAITISQAEWVKTEKLLALKAMHSEVDKDLKQLMHLYQRKQLFTKKILKQAQAQAEAALTAYTNGDGDFSEVVRARVTELNAHTSSLKIDVDALKTVTSINYYLDYSGTTSHPFSESQNNTVPVGEQ